MLAAAAGLAAAKTPAGTVVSRGEDGYTIVALEKKAGRKDVKKGQVLKLHGLTDGNGREILPTRYESLGRLQGTLFYFGERQPQYSHCLFGLIDASSGKIILPATSAKIEVTRDGFIRYSGSSVGLLDATGKELLPPRFAEIGDFSEDLMPVSTGWNGWWVDRNFQPVLQQKQFAQVWAFRDGKAVVATNSDHGRPTQFKTVDREGNILGDASDPRQTVFMASTNKDLPCPACNGSGGRFETTQESSNRYADIGGRAGDTKAVTWTQSKRIGDCFTCGGSGRAKPRK